MKQIVFTRPNTAELLDVPVKKPGDSEVLVRTVISTIPCGTERANITGSCSVNAGIAEEAEAHFPRCCGYSTAGIVEETGAAVKSVRPGDRVVAFAGYHCAFNTLPEQNVVKIESDDVSLNEAALGYIASFAMAGVRKTRVEMGESCMIMGLGLLGQLAVQFARAAGALPLLAADPLPGRRAMALKLGADYALDPFEADFAEKARALSHGGVQTAVEVTGRGEGLNEVLDCVARCGRVALLGCTRSSDFQVDYYRKVHYPGITLIGAHTSARPAVDSRPGWFTHRDDIQCMLRMCAYGRIHLKDMVAEVHAPSESASVYDRLIHEKDFPTVVQFDWTK